MTCMTLCAYFWQGMHKALLAELQQLKDALQKSEQARIYAEVQS